MRPSLLVAALFWVFLLTSCGGQEKEAVCTQEAKICPDGTAVGRIGLDCRFEECPAVPATGEIYCEQAQRNVDACAEIYQPVCGWNDPEKIQCIRYPCAQTFPNPCFACMNNNVLYYTQGECPA